MLKRWLLAFGSPSRKRVEKEKKEKRTRAAIAKFFALNGNAIITTTHQIWCYIRSGSRSYSKEM